MMISSLSASGAAVNSRSALVEQVLVPDDLAGVLVGAMTRCRSQSPDDEDCPTARRRGCGPASRASGPIFQTICPTCRTARRSYDHAPTIDVT